MSIVDSEYQKNIELLNLAIEKVDMTLFNQIFPLVLLNVKDDNFPHIGLLFMVDYFHWDNDKTTMFNLLFDSMHYRDSQRQKERDFTQFISFAGKYLGYHDDLTYLSDFLNIAQKFIAYIDFSQSNFRNDIINSIEKFGFHSILPLLEKDFKEDLNYFKAFMNYAALMDDSEKGLNYLNHLCDISYNKFKTVLTSASHYHAEQSFLMNAFYACSDNVFKRLVELGARLNTNDIKHINETLINIMNYENTTQKMEFYNSYLEQEKLDSILTTHEKNKKQFKI